MPETIRKNATIADMDETPRRKSGFLFWLLLVLCIAALGALGYGWYTLEQTRDNLAATNQSLTTLRATSTIALSEASTTIGELQSIITQLEEELDDTKDDLRREERRNEEFEEELRDTINTVRDLDKLSKTDEELLQQYSRVYFLNENFIPSRLSEIDEEYIAVNRSDQYFHSDALPFLEDLLEDAARDNIDLTVVSAYRSFDQQAQLKGQYLQSYGTGSNTFSADQGYSEHQLGTALDFSTPELGGVLAGFGDTEAFQWLLDNAYKHGFILSYPEGNAFYVYEPWHWRFVGENLARDLNADNRSFYEVPQRELNEYLLTIFD